MAAFVGEMDCYKFFEWACEVGICKPGDEVRRMILDVGMEDVVRVHIEKYTDSEHIEVRLPEIRNVKRVEQGTTRVVGVRDGTHVRELTSFGHEFCALQAKNTRLTSEVGALKKQLADAQSDKGDVIADIAQPPDVVRGDDAG